MIMSDLREKIQREFSHDADGIGGEIEEVIAVSHLPEIISLCMDEAIEALLDVYTHNSVGEDYEQRCIVGYRTEIIKVIEKLKYTSD
jgi:hypothetical protein